MTLELNLNKLAAKLALIASVLAISGLLVILIISNFITGMLTDERLRMDRNALAAGADYFPDSARLQARLARVEMLESKRDLSKAEAHAERAVNLSPYNYRPRLLLASIQEMKGDRASAEQSLRAALKLAPYDKEAHWRLANLLLRQGNLDESLEEFRAATRTDRSLLPATLDLVWRASGGNVEAMKKVTSDEPLSKFSLVRFLMNQSRIKEAAEVFGSIDREPRLASAESGAFLNSLVAAGEVELARSIWDDMLGGDRDRAVMWNGGFENDILKNFTQFDWGIEQSKYARIIIDTRVARTGSRSLRIDFAGLNTTSLDREIKQLLVARAGGRYRLECYVKTQGLVAPEGPRIVVSDNAKWIAASPPVASGSNDWQQVFMDFVAPTTDKGTAPALYVSIKRKPEFSYDEPTRGTVWFDDFKIIEQ